MPSSRPSRFVLADLLKNLPPLTLPSMPSLNGSALLEAMRRVRSDMDGLFGRRVENGRLVDRPMNIPLPNPMRLQQELRSAYEAGQRDRPQCQSGYPCGRLWGSFMVPASVLFGQPSPSASAESPASPRSQHWRMLYTPQGNMGVCHAAIDDIALLVPLVAVEFSRPWESHAIGTIVFRPEWLAREWGGWGARTVAPDHHVFFLDEHEFNGIVMPAADEHQPGFSLKVQMDNLQIRALAGGVKLVEWDTPPMTARHVERLAQQSDRRSVSVGYTCTVDRMDDGYIAREPYVVQRHVDIRSVSLRRDMEMLGFANPELQQENLEIVARHRNAGYERLFDRHAAPSQEHQSTAAIDDASCAYYVDSPWLKCTVNPSGPCDRCGHYEPLGADLEP